jgi:hypothetical protein
MHAFGIWILFLLSILMPVQMMIFVVQPANEAPMWRSYMAAWRQTFSFVGRAAHMLFVGNKAERKMSIAALLWAVLCIPGIVIVGHAINVM